MLINYGVHMSFEAIVFFDLLGRPISKDEISHYNSRKIASYVKSHLNDSVALLEPTTTLFKGAEYFSFFDQYTLRNLLNASDEFTKTAWRKVQKYSWIFKFMPFIKMVAVCNTLAFGTSKKNSDIDLFVITTKNRMFTARLVLTLFCHILGIRRHGSKVAQRFCLSFFISEDSLNIENILLKPLDIYMIYWMRGLKIVYGKEVLNQFIESNIWYQQYFNNVSVEHLKFLNEGSGKLRIKGVLEKMFSGRLGLFVEEKLKKWQLNRASEKKKSLGNSSGTIISSTMLKFHDNDRRGEFLTKWEKGLKGF